MNRVARTSRPQSSLSYRLDALESRTLLSSSHILGALHDGLEHGQPETENHGGGGGEVLHTHGGRNTPTPVTDLTGNALTFSQIVGLPAVQLPGEHASSLSPVEHILPAVQDVATITSATVPPNLRGYTVSIDWGDGSAATRGALVVDNAGLIHVKGFHRYTDAGSFNVTITVTPPATPTTGTTTPVAATPLVIVSTANVTQNSTGGVTVTPTTGQVFTGTVGTFSLPTGSTASTDPTTFTAMISWGDHSHSVGTVTLNDDGSYSVAGMHTYAAAGSYRIGVLVLQNDTPTPVTTAARAGSSRGDSHLAGDGFMRNGCSFGRHTQFISLIFSTATVTDAAATV